MKHFIITVDTEGDNLWEYHDGGEVKTENTLAIPRFQTLCEQFGFKPVYLTNYEMICDDRFVKYLKPKAESGLCEVGIHIHAWNNPPYHQLEQRYNGNPYLIEYPKDVMRKKFEVTYFQIKDRIGIPPVSHRAGRWVMNDVYFELLNEFGIKIDCSFTPLVSWQNSPGRTLPGGNDYTNVVKSSHCLGEILEVPMTIRNVYGIPEGSLKQRLKSYLKGKIVWLRPALSSLEEMKALCKMVSNERDGDYLEFMLHSSELMAGGSPYFKTQGDIDALFNRMSLLFEFVTRLGYEGKTLLEYRNEIEK